MWPGLRLADICDKCVVTVMLDTASDRSGLIETKWVIRDMTHMTGMTEI